MIHDEAQDAQSEWYDFFRICRMLSVQITDYKTFSDLPLEQFNSLGYPIFIVDFDWNYLFVNDFVKSQVGDRAGNLAGKNMWTAFKPLATDPVFRRLRSNLDNRIITNIVVTSPLTFQLLNIVGYPLDDCFYFSMTPIPEKNTMADNISSEFVKAGAR